MITVGCMLQAYHTPPDSPSDSEPLDSPGALRRLIERSGEIDTSRIVNLYLSQETAQKIVCRLWPGESLLGATCGRGFPIETAEQVAIINEILAPDLSIFLSQKHEWLLQTWPEDDAE